MRRTIPAILASGALLLALSIAAPAVLAQDQTMADQPIVGAWLAHPSPGDSTQVSLIAFEPSGTLITTDQDGTTGVGAWTATGDGTVELTFEEPTTGPDGHFAGLTTIRASGQVSADGQSFSGTWTLELPEAEASAVGLPAGELGPGQVTAERISVSSMGEPVGPLPQASTAP
jgi:hypothetical protein